MADVAGGAEGAQRLDGAGLLGVAAGDRDAAGEHDPRDAGQAGAADADEVHGAELVGGQQGLGDRDPHRRDPCRVPGRPRIISASLSSASSGITSRRRPDIAARRSGSVSRSGTRARVTHSGRQRGVGDHQPAARVHHGAGVQRLLAVADRQRHVDRRQADAGHLGDGVAARPGTATASAAAYARSIRLDERHRDVRRPAERDLRRGLALGTDDVQHLHPGSGEGGRGRGDGLVEPACALGPPGHQQRRPVRVEPEGLARLGPQRRPVEGADHPADRQADVARVRQRRCPGSWWRRGW